MLYSCELPSEYTIWHWTEDWINTIDIDGKNLIHLSTTKTTPAYGEISIPFLKKGRVKILNSNGYSISVMNNDGTNDQILANNLNSHFYNVSISSDGDHIAFVNDGSLYIMQSDGSNKKRLTDSTNIISTPDFSPDGEKIIFISKDRNNYKMSNISIIDTAGINKQVITDNSEDNSTISYFKYPRFNPDGETIFYNYNSHDLPGGLYSIKKDGSHITLVYESILASNPVSFSEDGTVVVFSFLKHIYTINKNGSGLKNLGEICEYYECFPRISSNGELIIFGTGGSNTEIKIINSDGTNIKHIAKGDKPFFFPDESKIIFIGKKWISSKDSG